MSQDQAFSRRLTAIDDALHDALGPEWDLRDSVSRIREIARQRDEALAVAGASR